jgi:hypothetical protein
MRPARGFHARDAGGTTGLRRISSVRSMTSPSCSDASRNDSHPPAVPNARRTSPFDALLQIVVPKEFPSPPAYAPLRPDDT